MNPPIFLQIVHKMPTMTKVAIRDEENQNSHGATMCPHQWTNWPRNGTPESGNHWTMFVFNQNNEKDLNFHISVSSIGPGPAATIQ
jgi:hypothetical protein